MINCDLYVNVGAGDILRGESGAEYIKVGTGDVILFSESTLDIASGLAIPSEAELIIAATLLGPTDHEIEKCFLLDQSTGLIQEIVNAGSQNKRYVFCFAFDGATASEPTLEAWDDTNHNTNNLYSLGKFMNQSSSHILILVNLFDININN